MKKLFICLCFFKMNEYILQYINYDRNVLNHNQIRECRYYELKKMHEYFLFKKWIEYRIEDIELNDIVDFVSQLRTTPITNWWNRLWKYLSDSSVYNYLVSIRMFFKYVSTIWIRTRFNREQIPIFRCPDKKREPMTETEYRILRQAPLLYADSTLEWIRDELLIVIPRETWLRRAEIVRIRFEDFHHKNRQFQVLVKWWRYESVFFSESLRQKILDYEEQLKKTFPFTYREYVISHLKVRDRWKKFPPEKASTTLHKYVKILQDKWLIRKNITLHQARHSFAMRCVYSWLSQQATTQLMRHKDPKSTLQYYHLNDSRLLNQYDLIR